MLALVDPDRPVLIRSYRLFLREWTDDDLPAMVQLFDTAVGARFRGRALARRAIDAVLPVAAAAGLTRAQLLVATDNLPSQRVAASAEFALTAEPLVHRERKGYALDLATWERPLG